MHRIELPADPAEALTRLREDSAARPVVVFKKSPICPVSTWAEAQFDAWRAQHEADDIAYAVIDVIAEKPLARGLVAELRVQHQSPQALVFKDGECTWHDSHHGLTTEEFEARC